MLHRKALPKLETLEQLQLSYTSSSVAKKSESSCKTYIKHYRKIYDNYAVKAFPPSKHSIKVFLTALAYQGYSSSALQQARAAIKWETVRRGHEWLTDHDQVSIKYLIKGAANTNDRDTRQVKPITNDLLRPIIKMLEPDNQVHTIFATMWAVAHDALLRHEELANLCIKDVRWSESKATLNIFDPKTAKGKTQHAYLYNNHPLSGYSLLKAMWKQLKLSERSDKSALLFPKVSDSFPTIVEIHADDESTHKSFYVSFLRQRLLLAGISNITDFTPHSFRTGGATDLHNKGASEDLIKRLGRWRSATYKLYIRHIPEEEIQKANIALSKYARA